MSYYAQHPDDGPEAREREVEIQVYLTVELVVPFTALEGETDGEIQQAFYAKYGYSGDKITAADVAKWWVGVSDMIVGDEGVCDKGFLR